MWSLSFTNSCGTRNIAHLLFFKTKNCNIFPPCKPAILSSNLYDAVKELDSNCGELEEVSRILHNGEVFYAVTYERHIKREPFDVLLCSWSVAIIKKFLYSRQTNRVYVVVDDFQKMMSLFRDRLPMLTKIKKNSQANERFIQYHYYQMLFKHAHLLIYTICIFLLDLTLSEQKT